jgi:hypothetical protein
MMKYAMAFELSKDQLTAAIALIVHCFRVSREESVGLIAAGGSLDFFLAKTGASLYKELWLMP